MKRISWLLLAILVVGIGAFALTRSNPGGGEQNLQTPLVVLSYGGDFEEAQRHAFFGPFEKAFGGVVKTSSYGGEYGHLKGVAEAAARTGNPPPYDVVDVESSALMRGIADGLFMKLDQSKIRKDGLLPSAINDYGIATDYYSVSMAWNTKAFPANGPQPNSWADFWDTTRFPGPRALKRDARFTLEIALLADGLRPDQIYVGGKMDINRAFKSLDRIKPHVKVWWTSGQQPIQLLSQGDIALAAAFGARLWAAQHKDKAPIAMTWKNGILDVEYWAILKGARSAENAHRFIDFASRPEQQALLPQKLPLGPVNQGAFKLIPGSLANDLNTSPANFSSQLLLSAEYWQANEERVQERFNTWLAK